PLVVRGGAGLTLDLSSWSDLGLVRVGMQQVGSYRYRVAGAWFAVGCAALVGFAGFAGCGSEESVSSSASAGAAGATSSGGAGGGGTTSSTGSSSTGGGSTSSSSSSGSGGSGGAACGPGVILCGEVCVDSQNDPAHCGSCDVACGAEEVCSEGRC